MSDKTSTSSLVMRVCVVPTGHSLTTRDWDSIRISERSVSSRSPGDSLLTSNTPKSTHTHHRENTFPLAGGPPVVSIKEPVQSMS